MLQRERLQTRKLTIRKRPPAARVVILAAVAGYRLCLRVRVVGRFGELAFACVVDVVIWGVGWDCGDCVVDCAEAGEGGGGVGVWRAAGAVSGFWEGWEGFAGSVIFFSQ